MWFAQTAALQLYGCAVVVCGCGGAATAASAGAPAAAAAVALAAVAGSTQNVNMILRKASQFWAGEQLCAVVEIVFLAIDRSASHSSPAQPRPPSPALPAATGQAQSVVFYGVDGLGGAS